MVESRKRPERDAAGTGRQRGAGIRDVVGHPPPRLVMGIVFVFLQIFCQLNSGAHGFTMAIR